MSPGYGYGYGRGVTGTVASGGGGGDGPPHSADLYAYYDPSNESTVLTDVDGVYEVHDSQGNMEKLIQATGPKKPQTATQNGLQCIDFDGVDDLLYNTAVGTHTPTTGWTYFVVMERKRAANEYFQHGSPITDLLYGGMVVSPGRVFANYGGSGSAIYVHTSSFGNWTSAADQFYLLQGQDPMTPGDVFTEIKGYPDATYDESWTTASNKSSLGIQEICVGGFWDETQHAQGRWLGTLIYDKLLDAPARAEVVAYLETKWGLSQAAPPAPTPPPVAGYIAYFDSDFGVLTDVDGVYEWQDQSGNNHHVVQATGSKKPQVASEGGQQVIAYDATDDALMDASFPDPATDITVVVGAKIGTGTGRAIFDISQPTQTNRGFNNFHYPPNMIHRVAIGGNHDVAYAETLPAQGVYTTRCNANGVIEAWKDGVSKGTAPIATQGSVLTNLVLGSLVGLNYSCNGWIRRVAIYYSALSPTDRASVEAWVQDGMPT